MPNTLIQNRKERRKQKRQRRGKTPVQPELSIKAPTERRNNDSDRPSSSSAPKRSAKRSASDRSASSLQNKRSKDDPYAHLDPEVASKLRREDAEIAELEGKLGLADKKEKLKLHREYAKEEGYGDDFGDFLDGLDDMVNRIQSNQDLEDNSETGFAESELDNDSSDSDDEHVQMKPPNKTDDSSYSEEDEHEAKEKQTENQSSSEDDEASSQDSDDDDDDDEASSEDSDNDEESSHDPGDFDVDSSKAGEEESEEDPKDTYKPSEGEDIYGNKVDNNTKSMQQSKYVPPHMRGKGQPDEKAHQESLVAIRRSLNNSLNRLSEDTLVTVAQSISRLYAPYPTAHVNECIWENTKNACVARSYVMTGLAPIYAAALVGVHIEKGDSAQLAQHLIEMTVADLFKVLPSERSKSVESDIVEQETGGSSKDACNLVLLLCYLYNFDLAHCSLIYDIVRDLIKSFTEIDVELLLIILSHCGRSLRSDDPSGLKDIVLDVQQRVMKSGNTFKNASRVDYMVSALMDLKNNKRRQQDAVSGEKTARLRKLIGQLKAVSQGSGRSGRESSSSLRIRLKDILEAETKGRWWKVGASWEGNQYQFNGGEDAKSNDEKNSTEEKEEEDKLLRLAAKYRMNSDTRRSIFCIIMGSADFEDAFEKLEKAGMLKNKTERETSRVLMECCGNEKTYNSFYEHLVKRICEYQPQCKFSLQLAYWDSFKQFDSMKPRKAANLAKLLVALVVRHRILRISVLKGIDMTSPEDLSEIGMIFMTLFFTALLEYFDNPGDVSAFFEKGMPHLRQEGRDGDDEEHHARAGETEALYASFSLFFVQVLKDFGRSKGSKFRKNLKAAVKACDTDNFFM